MIMLNGARSDLSEELECYRRSDNDQGPDYH